MAHWPGSWQGHTWGETCCRWGAAWTWGRALAPQNSGVQAGSCPALQGTLGWSLTHLLGAAEKGTGIEEAFLVGKAGVSPHPPGLWGLPEGSLVDLGLSISSSVTRWLGVVWNELSLHSSHAEACVTGSLPAASSPLFCHWPCLQWIHRFQGPRAPDCRTKLGAQLGPYWQVRTVE